MATLRDIAEKAGVSIGTVDRVLHKRGRFSPETARKVHQIISEVGYRPNLMARRLSDARSCRIGVLLPFPEQDSGYWSLPLSGIKRAAEELEAFGLTMEIRYYNRYRDRSDNGSFSQAGSELLDTDPDGILMAPLIEQSTRRFLGQLKPDTPVIFFDTDLPGVRRTAYIGQDSYQSGRLGARLLHMLIDGKSTGKVDAGREGDIGSHILLVSPDMENDHLKNRIRGFQDGSRLEVEILKVSVESDQNQDHFIKQLQNHLQLSSTDPVAGIFVCDASAHFVAEYLKNHTTRAGQKSDSLPLVGYDLVRENRHWLQEGIIDFLLTQRPSDQGYNGVNRLFRKIFLDEDGPENEYTPIDIVTSENLNYLMTEAGG